MPDNTVYHILRTSAAGLCVLELDSSWGENFTEVKEEAPYLGNV